MNERFWQSLKDIVEARLKVGSTHSFDHVERVTRFAIYIGEKVGADMDVLKASALLHDIARDLEDENPAIDHAEEGAKMAEKILAELGFPRSKIESVVYAIRVHRFRKGEKPKTIEAQILQDADRLDALGAMGIYRTIYHSGRLGRSVEETVKHFKEKILRLPDFMNTLVAKELARKKVKIVKEFVEALEADMRGDIL